MSTFTYKFPGVGDRVVDTLLLYALSDLAKKADLEASFEWSLGHDVIFTLHSAHSDIQNKMLKALRRNARSMTVANRLNFWLNIGNRKWMVDPKICIYCMGKRGKDNPCNLKGDCGAGNAPAYSIFLGNLNDVSTIDWKQTQLLLKHKQGGYKTLYIGLSPFWSKGVRSWDSKWDDKSSYLPAQVQVLLLYGLAHYAVIEKPPFAQIFIELIFSPPFGTYLEYPDAQRFLELIKRIVNRFSLGVQGIRMGELPVKTLPLVLLSQMDIASITGLCRERPSLIFIAYDIDRAVPKNPRGYEEWSLTEVGNFYLNLGVHFWDFKCMIEDLAGHLWRNEFRARIQSILMDFSYAVSRKDVWLLNDALLKTKFLSRELRSIHLPTRDAILKAQKVIKRI
jgi:hypothetical protein